MTFHPPAEERARYARLGTTAVFVCLLILSLGYITGEAAAWQGEQVTVDGVLTVKNPVQAMEAPRTVELEELWRIGGDTDDEDQFFGVINRVIVDESGNAYLLDGQLSEIKVFDRDGHYLRTIGREGEGPGEFRQAQDMFFVGEELVGVLQLAPGRIVQLTRDGDPAGEHPTPSREDGGFTMLLNGRSVGDQLVMIYGYNHFQEGLFSTTRSLIRLGPDGEIMNDYCTGQRHINFADPVIEEKQWDGFENRWALGADGKVYVAETWGEYAITVLSSTGEKERVITRELKARKRSQAEKDRLAAIYEPFIREVPNGRPGIEDVDHPINQLHVRDDGTTWVLNAYGAFDRPEGSIGTFDVFDPGGRFLREVTLMGQGDPLMDGYFFIGERLYVLTGFMDAAMSAAGGASDEATDEEAEPMAVICYNINGDI